MTLLLWFDSYWWFTKNTPSTSRMSHYGDVIMSTMASQITSLTIVYSIVYSRADRRKTPKPASLAFMRGIHREPVNSPHKRPVTQKIFSFDDVIMAIGSLLWLSRRKLYLSITRPQCIFRYHWIYDCKHVAFLSPWLTHWSRDKMAAISQTTYLSALSAFNLEWNIWILIKMSMRFVPLKNIPLLFHITAWRRPFRRRHIQVH